MKYDTDIAIIGAGPFGLSIAAHLQSQGAHFRIFGIPMHSWRFRMPAGMHLKSDGFASDIYDPDSSFTLEHYCRDQGLPYQDIGLPVPLETFTRYGLEFQRRMVPGLEETEITHLQQSSGGFILQTGSGDVCSARQVVIAVGVSHFAYTPDAYSSLPAPLVSHSSAHHSLEHFRGRQVAVLGGGSSAVDLAILLHEAGCNAHLVARRPALNFHSPPHEPRPLLDRIRQPRSGLGLGWKSRLCEDAPLLFHALPQRLRLRAVRRHLGPSPGWFTKDRFAGKVPATLGVQSIETGIANDQLTLTLSQGDGTRTRLAVDHLITATGYRVSLQRLPFVAQELRDRIKAVEDTPILNSRFETSVPGLFMVGLAAANSFGPLFRFACGARFTARRIMPALLPDRS